MAVETQAVAGACDRLTRVASDESGRSCATACVALLVVDHRFQGVELGGNQIVIFLSAMPHAGNIIYRKQLFRFPWSNGLRDQLLVSLGFARTHDRVCRAVHDDER